MISGRRRRVPQRLSRGKEGSIMRAQISRIMLVLALAATFAASLPVAPALAAGGGSPEDGPIDPGTEDVGVRDVPGL